MNLIRVCNDVTGQPFDMSHSYFYIKSHRVCRWLFVVLYFELLTSLIPEIMEVMETTSMMVMMMIIMMTMMTETYIRYHTKLYLHIDR